MSGAAFGVLGEARRMPAAIAVTTAVAFIGVATGSHVGPADPSVFERYAFAADDLWSGEGWRALTAVFLTGRPLMFWALAPFSLIAIGLYERRSGTPKAVWLFLIGAVGVALFIAAAIVTPLANAGFSYWENLEGHRDAGMSGGGFAMLGALWTRAGAALQIAAATFLVAAIAVKFLWIAPEPIADLTHLIAYAAGAGFEFAVFKRVEAA